MTIFLMDGRSASREATQSYILVRVRASISEDSILLIHTAAKNNDFFKLFKKADMVASTTFNESANN